LGKRQFSGGENNRGRFWGGEWGAHQLIEDQLNDLWKGEEVLESLGVREKGSSESHSLTTAGCWGKDNLARRKVC